MAAAMEQDVRRALLMRSTNYKDIEPEALLRLSEVARQNDLTAKEVAGAFDKFMTVHRQESTAVATGDVLAFKAGFSKPAPKGTPRGNLFNRTSWEDAAILDSGPVEPAVLASGGPPSQRITPYLAKVAAVRPSPRTPATSAKFAERTGSGAVVASLNAHIELPVEGMDVDGGVAGRAEVEVLGTPLAPGVNFMRDRLEDQVGYLERRIAELSAALEAEAAGGRPLPPQHPVGVATQREALFVGRVRCDTEGGRLNAQSVLLEGSAAQSGGGTSRLDLSKCEAYRLLPGQVVAVRGTNPSGHCIAAAEVLAGLPAAMPRSTPHQLAAYAEAAGGRGLTAVVAAGPYTSSEDLAYEPLRALLAACGAAPPDVLLLLGPFVDAEHPALRQGLAEESFEAIYEGAVLAQLAEFAAGAGSRTRILLVPSTRDAHAEPVFPQPPAEGLPGGEAAGLPNPCTFRCRELVLGACSADWLKAAAGQELARGGAGAERLPALAAVVAEQRNYFPLFPPPPGSMLDSSKDGALRLPATPDLLVSPSDMAPFAKVAPASEAGRLVCINPGRLTKGATGGTYAHIYVAPHEEAAGLAPAATNAPVGHQADRRCRVEIRRI